jgi:hypothetical protein
MRKLNHRNRPDSISLEHFDIMSKLGKGGFSHVYLGSLE